MMAAGFMTFPLNLTKTYYFETLLLSRDVNKKMAEVLMIFMLNLTLTCYDYLM